MVWLNSPYKLNSFAITNELPIMLIFTATSEAKSITNIITYKIITQLI